MQWASLREPGGPGQAPAAHRQLDYGACLFWLSGGGLELPHKSSQAEEIINILKVWDTVLTVAYYLLLWDYLSSLALAAHK